MSEWWSVVAAFWVFYALDGVSVSRDAAWNVVSWFGGKRGTFRHHRVQLPSLWPGSWRVVSRDIPFAVSPQGICNIQAGSAARPAFAPTAVRMLSWHDVKSVSAERGWLVINGSRFCADTGHLSAAQLQALATRCAATEPAACTQILRSVLAGWLRPTHLRRRVDVLRHHTRTVATLNGALAVLLVTLSVYLLGNVADLLPSRWAATVAAGMPLFALYAVALHLAAVVLFTRAHRRLQPKAGERRVSLVTSALLLPPQAMRLRAAAGMGWFPAQHPLAWALAVGGAQARRELAFNTIADLRWPLAGATGTRPPGAEEILRWFRAELGRRVEAQVRASGLSIDALLASPRPDSPTSCRYCPRCHDQFVNAAGRCPHGISLEPLS